MFDEKILDKNDSYILGVSGGPDSMFLLDNLRILGYKLIVSHVNYGKRIESDADEELVKKYCWNFNLTFFAYKIKTEEYNNVKNFQSWAREKRYNFFQKIAEKKQIKNVVLAHHLDDHLETYWWQKERKSLVDCWGLAAKTPWQNIYILRPLLFFTKKQIFQYLAEKKITYSLDKTNYLPIYQRNVIRLKINNLSFRERDKLIKEIDQENEKLRLVKAIFFQQINKVINNSALNLSIWNSESSEVKLRLLYYWANKNTNKALTSRKKKILMEVKKQLESPKKKLIIFLSRNFQIKKNFPYAVLFNLNS